MKAAFLLPEDSPSSASFLLLFQVFLTTWYGYTVSLLSLYATCKDLILLTANFASPYHARVLFFCLLLKLSTAAIELLVLVALTDILNFSMLLFPLASSAVRFFNKALHDTSD